MYHRVKLVNPTSLSYMENLNEWHPKNVIDGKKDSGFILDKTDAMNGWWKADFVSGDI